MAIARSAGNSRCYVRVFTYGEFILESGNPQGRGEPGFGVFPDSDRNRPDYPARLTRPSVYSTNDLNASNDCLSRLPGNEPSRPR